ncbi:MAG: hypothetical protein J6P46_08200 [Bacteroidales bacterium]|nr:hypothetical protein [Bacteroidales bacterium]
MQSKNVRYSITFNDAQLEYLTDEQQDILRMKCLKTFIRMAVREETTVSGKNYSAVLQPGQFVASKVDLARMWECDRKTATRIVHEFNQLGILRSKASNRTTIHTLICLSAWFSSQGMKRSRFFDSNPVVKPIEKPARKAKRVPPETAVDTPKFDGAIPADPGGAQ